MSLQYDNKWTPFQLVQMGLIVFAAIGGYFSLNAGLEELAHTVARHERKLELIDDVNARLIRIEEKVDAIRGAERGRP